jgi:hypothetical protein
MKTIEQINLEYTNLCTQLGALTNQRDYELPDLIQDLHSKINLLKEEGRRAQAATKLATETVLETE